MEATTVVNPLTFPFHRMRCDNYQLLANQTQIDLNDVFRGRAPHLFWMVLVDDERFYRFGKDPFKFTLMNALTVKCMANGVPVPKASLNLTNEYEIYDLLLNASGKNKRDAYLLDPETFDEGFFIVPFDLTAVQDGGESSTPLLLVDIPCDLAVAIPPSKPCFSIIQTNIS